MVAAGEGLREGLRKEHETLGKDIMVVFAGRTSLQVGGARAGRAFHWNENDFLTVQQQSPACKHVLPELGNNVPIHSLNNSASLLVTGSLPPFAQVRSVDVSQGRFYNDDDNAAGLRVAFLGGDAKKQLFGNRPALGESIWMADVPYTVIGVMKNKQQNSSYDGFDVRKIFIPYNSMVRDFPDRPPSLLPLQKAVEVGDEVRAIPFLRADDFPRDPALAIDDVRFRVHKRAVQDGDLFRGVAVSRELDVMGLEELFVSGGVFIHADAEHRPAARRDSPLEPIERSRFFDAGRAPSRPKVQDHHPAAQVGERGGFAIQHEGKLARRTSCRARFALTVVGTGEEHQQPDDACRNEARQQFSLQPWFHAPYNIFLRVPGRVDLTPSVGITPSPVVSAIVPARDEEVNIARTLESLNAQLEIVEIVVANDGSKDRTGAVLVEMAARMPKLRVLETHERPRGWMGKSYAASLGGVAAVGEWLLFTATVHLPGSIRRALADAEEHGAALVSHSPQQEMNSA